MPILGKDYISSSRLEEHNGTVKCLAYVPLLDYKVKQTQSKN